MAIDPMGLIFTKIHPKTCCFVLMDGALLAVGFTLAKNCGFKSLLQPIIVLRQSSVDDILPILEFH
jgi:hypothetical protein